MSILVEEHIWKTILKEQNPILAATYLIYTKYNQKYFDEIKTEVEKLIIHNLSAVTNKNILLHKELWWLFIFIDCPYLDQRTKHLISTKVSMLKSNDNTKPNGKIQNILFDFLNTNTNSNKFFEWDIESKDIIGDITYLTYERTLFKNNDKDLFLYEY